MVKKLSLANNPLAGGGGDNTPPTLSLEEADRMVYGGIDTPTSNRVVARPVALTDIKPDVKQPRRVIPASIRKGWTGDVSRIPDMLREWRAAAERALGEQLDPVRLLDKLGDGREADKDIPPIVDEYLALCSLAASIKRDGLVNPIQITRANVIVTGERRYMAHWLLNTWLSGFDTIPAQVVGEADVWLQAAENGARRPLNAIGMSRQLALLIMEMYVGDDGVRFDDIGFFNHEREFYAQVANGNIWRIKKGMGERVLQVTGLKSLGQVNHYRALLSISSGLWDEADMNNWTEFRIRETLNPREEQKVNSVYTSTTVEVSAQPITTPIQNQFVEFDRKMRDALRQLVYRQPHQGFYVMANLGHIFIGWNSVKNGYESVTAVNGHEEAKMQWNPDVLISLMFQYQKEFEGWKLVKREDFMVMIRPHVPRNQPFTPSPTPTPPTIDRERVLNNIIGEDDEPPYMPEDDEDAEEWALHQRELAQIEADVQEWKAQQPPVVYEPPPDFDQKIFDEGSPQWLFAQSVRIYADLIGNEPAKHVATMLMTLTKKDALTWTGGEARWMDVVGGWHIIFSEMVADMVNGIFNQLDSEGKK
ncbi:MAG: ParB/RepB/Spo0J family partition protein, partial [Anaerolineae bacterium]|jgi:hypothetical protein|nr:ParB/RepB/Spo0J family partition protein [Anaerolineae bacterium]